MKPVLPDTPVLRALQGMTREDLDAEVLAAERLVSEAETYLAWVRLGQQLVASLDSTDEDDRATAAVVVSSGAKSRNGDKPSLRRGILMVMQTERRVWKKSEIGEALAAHGWEPQGQKPSSQIATRLAEMIERGEVERVSIGHYALPDVAEELRGAPA